MAAGNLLDIYLSFRFLLAAWKAYTEKGYHRVFGRCSDYLGYTAGNAAEQGCVWRAYADWFLYAAYEFAGQMASKDAGFVWSAWKSVIVFLTRNVNDGYLGFERLNLLTLPEALYKNLFTTYLGFTEKDFYSTDYFSLIPWLFLFLAGYFTFRFLKGKRVMEYLKGSFLPPVEWLGRHSLVIYMLHQPLLYLGLELMF